MAHHPSAAAEPEIPVVPVAVAEAGPENRYAVAAAVSDSSAASAVAEAAQWAAGMYIAELASAAPAASAAQTGSANLHCTKDTLWQNH